MLFGVRGSAARKWTSVGGTRLKNRWLKTDGGENNGKSFRRQRKCPSQRKWMKNETSHLLGVSLLIVLYSHNSNHMAKLCRASHWKLNFCTHNAWRMVYWPTESFPLPPTQQARDRAEEWRKVDAERSADNQQIMLKCWMLIPEKQNS